MKKITFSNFNIFYGKEKIGTYTQIFANRFIPEFVEKWEWIYYQFDFIEGDNGDEGFFKNKIIESIEKVYSCF